MNRNLSGQSSWVRTITLRPPTLDDNRADADRLLHVLKADLQADRIQIDLSLLQKLPALLRTSEWKIQCVLFKDRHKHVLIDAMPAGDTLPVAGLAVDLGTTRVVLRLLDLVTGRALNETAFDNPQTTIGHDILTRIHHADTVEGLNELRRLIVDGINLHSDQLGKSRGITTDRIFAMSVAGNTAMTHLLLGISPRWIIREPYIPGVNIPPVLFAKELGLLLAPRARVLVFPNVGSYFGGDLIAGILYSGVHNREETSLLVDVGTNAEVLVGNRQWLMACAGAAGPALEGDAARIGMPAGPGAIDRIRIVPDTRQFEIHTIDEKPPKGICGSGLIDLAAQLFSAGMIDVRGKFVEAECRGLLREIDGVRHLVVAPDTDVLNEKRLTLSQIDLDSLIRAKAAMYTILSTVVGAVGIDFHDIATFYVAGTFGECINPESAIRIGMLPDIPRNRFVSIGNSSLEGAALALIINNCLEEIDKIRNLVTYLELNVNQEFMARFSAAKFLPHTDRRLFPSVGSRYQ